MRYGAIIFDMGDVFFDATGWRRWLTGHLQSLGVHIDYPALCRQWEQYLVEVYLGRRPYWDRFQEFLTSLGLGPQAVADTLAVSRRRAQTAEQRTLFEGVAATLARLKEMGVRLAVLSDTESPAARVRQRLATLGIDEYFDAVVASVEIGHVKPQPEAFAAALASLGESAERTLFVGHDEDELQGAMACGLTAVAFNYQPPVPAHHYIQQFAELTELVQ